METLLGTFISYLVSLVANEHTDRIHKKREATLMKKVTNDNLITRALKSRRSLQDEVTSACVRLAQDKDKLGLNIVERRLWVLLTQPDFQKNLLDWLMAGALPEGDKIKVSLFKQITDALNGVSISQEKLQYLKTEFFEQLEKSFFANDILARWRHQKSLDYLREQVVKLRQRADEAAGIYDSEKQADALRLYCDEAFKTWDIIDLTNLPEGDVDVATQNLLVRQLYMPLRIAIEENGKSTIESLEENRDLRRQIEAGYTVEKDRRESKSKKAGIGEWLQQSARLVVLGDPGGGKTTMLRWLATAMLLRYRQDPALDQLPDVSTLPANQWIPVLIRCRDLGEADLCRCFSDFLNQHFLKTTLPPEQAKVMQSLILEKIASNQVLIMVDGLDEITNAQVRVRFCQEIERTAARYPETPIIVTSRIVGYRDMPYRLGANFRHGVISELDRKHKDLFAKRWIEVTDQRLPPDERARRERELIDALHASDRVERLTGNPMLLTTLALVKRKVGKLPSRRNKLYAEAVAVLLNWNPGFYETIEESEAIPQLEYLAFEMCRRGIQRLTDDEIMDLLEQFRRDYPAVRAVRNHSEREFLALLEARSSILIRAGSVWEKGFKKEQAAWEFRHLTFQEYLAAQALLDGRYPNRNKTLPLAMQVAPLAGIVHRNKNRLVTNDLASSEVPESWREALRLLVADCKDDDVDDVLHAILQPVQGEDQSVTRRTRAVLAALCLADEPNTSEEMAQFILDTLFDVILDEDGYSHYETPLASALTELNRSEWRAQLKTALVQRYIEGSDSTKNKYGSIWGYISTADWTKGSKVEEAFLQELLRDLNSGDKMLAVGAALTVMNAAYDGKLKKHVEFIEPLFSMIAKEGAEQSSACWALGWLFTGDAKNGTKPLCTLNRDQTEALCHILLSAQENAIDTQFWLTYVIGLSGHAEFSPIIAKFLESRHKRIRKAAIVALGRLKSAVSIDGLYKLAEKEADYELKVAAGDALASLGDMRGKRILGDLWNENIDSTFERDRTILKVEKDDLNKALLSRDIDGKLPLIPVTVPIDSERLRECARQLKVAVEVIRNRYEQLANDYPLTLSWTKSGIGNALHS